MSIAPTASNSEHTDVRPMVRTGSAAKWGPWVFGGVLAILALLLFQALDNRRLTVVAPSTTVPAGSADARIVSPPPLVLPSRFDGLEAMDGAEDPFRLRRAPEPAAQGGFGPRPPRTVTGAVQRAVSSDPPSVTTAAQPTLPPSQPFYPPPQPQTVFDRGASSAAPAAGANTPEGAPPKGADRVRASRLDAPSFTVPQGTVIAAVLETALDSTKPGFARALVSRDVKSFDGTRVLIPRGSRLFGEYDASLEQGQNRALIRWIRLTRPDGVRMELDSPSADALGRAGIKGGVDTKFLQRFGGAILQSVLDVGVGLATRRIRDRGVIVALPGSSQIVNPGQQQQVKPTLRIRQGSRVTVFVARDLDFSDVEG